MDARETDVEKESAVDARESQDLARGMKRKFVDLMSKFNQLQKKVAAQNAMAAQLEAQAQKFREEKHAIAQSNPLPAMTAAGNPTPSGAVAKPESKILKEVDSTEPQDKKPADHSNIQQHDDHKN
jgi:hypothetical protein